jgi:glycosyltransferase involved in cell wall biosynthesis
MTKAPVAPSVSIIIPTYNRAAYVGDAIESCLQHGDASFEAEVVVVDDGSTDDTAAVLTAFEGRIRVIALVANQGRNKARNTGLANATGRYVKFLDSDDVLETGSLRVEAAAAMQSNADIVIAGWRTVGSGRAGRVESITTYDAPMIDPVIDRLLEGKAVPTSAALYEGDLVRDLKWDESLRKLDDWDWFIRAALRARKIVRTPTVAYSWTQHAGQGVRSETMLRNAQEHHTILRKLEDALVERGELTAKRKARLAQYFYKELRVLSVHDRPGFEWGVHHIHELDPRFAPRDEEKQWWMRVAGRLLGVKRAVAWHSMVKKSVSGSNT